jgi:hypothetical protein
MADKQEVIQKWASRKLAGLVLTSRLLLIRLFQPKPDILRVVEPSTTTAGGDLKQPDKQESASVYR